MAKSIARKSIKDIKDRLRSQSARGERLAEELEEEMAEEAEAAEEVDQAHVRAQAKHALRQHRPARHKPSVRQAKVHVARSMERLNARNIGIEAIKTARTHVPGMNVVSRRPIESAAVALLAGILVGSLPIISKSLGKLIAWGVGLCRK